MKKLLSLFVAITSLTLVLAGCNDGNGVESVDRDGDQASVNAPPVDTPKSLAGTSWKLTGVLDVATGSVTPPPAVREPNEKYYTLEFKEDGTFYTISSINSFHGAYVEEFRENEDVHKIQITDFHGTKMYGNELNLVGDELWWTSFRTINSFTLLGKELKLFYNDGKNALVFKSIPIDKESNIIVPYTEYPEIEYLLSNDMYDWRQRQDFEHILVINSYDELKNHIPSADGNYPDVDFSKSSILFAVGGTATRIYNMEKNLLKVSENKYNLNIVLDMTDATQPDIWVVVIITNKLSKNSDVILNVEKIGW